MLQAIELEWGQVPASLRALACDAASLRATWDLIAGALLAPRRVPRTTKELGALAAFSVGRVPGLQAQFRQALAARGVGAEVLDDLAREGTSGRLPERTRGVIDFLRRASLQPARLSDADYTRLRRLGLDEPELAELVAAAAAIGLLVSLARALGSSEG